MEQGELACLRSCKDRDATTKIGVRGLGFYPQYGRERSEEREKEGKKGRKAGKALSCRTRRACPKPERSRTEEKM